MTYSNLHVHLVWATLRREPMISVRVAEFLVRYLPAVALQENAAVLAMGIVATHIHVLGRLSPTTSIPRLVQRFKGGSSRVAEIEGHTDRLRWAQGYSVSSVSSKNLGAVLQYLEHQPQRHPHEAITGWTGYVCLIPTSSV